MDAADRSAIADILARYAWLVDEGDGDGYAALWADDGTFTGVPEPMIGKDALRLMPPGFHALAGGKLRHMYSDIVIEAGAGPDEARSRCYSRVYDLRGAGSLRVFAKLYYDFERQAGQWKIKRLHADMLLASL